MSLDYLQVFAAEVQAAGSRTANTFSDWSWWASQSENLLRNTAGGARSTKVTTAFETYLAHLRPNLQQLGVRASNLGTNATGAANLVSDADGEGAAVLRTQNHHAEQQRSWLLRPVDAPR